MNTRALSGGALTASATLFGDGLPEPNDTELLAMADVRIGRGAPDQDPSPGSQRARALAISAAMVFAMLAYLGVWAAIIGVILAIARALMRLLGAPG
jgi:hypothetical protein